MPQTEFSLDPNLTAIECPRCPKCAAHMMFTGMVSGPPNFDIRMFECLACDHVEKVATGANMMGWINSRALLPPS